MVHNDWNINTDLLHLIAEHCPYAGPLHPNLHTVILRSAELAQLPPLLSGAPIATCEVWMAYSIILPAMLFDFARDTFPQLRSLLLSSRFWINKEPFWRIRESTLDKVSLSFACLTNFRVRNMKIIPEVLVHLGTEMRLREVELDLSCAAPPPGAGGGNQAGFFPLSHL